MSISRSVFAPLPRAAVEAIAGRRDQPSRFVIHLPVTVADLATAKNLAATLARSVAFLPEINGGETTVSIEDNQAVRHRVFCDLMLVGRRRCALRADHDGACAPRWSR